MQNIPLAHTIASRGEPSRWYSATLWHTMNLSALWRLLRVHGFRVSASRWPRIATAIMSAVNNSILGALQSALYGSLLRDTEIKSNPLFVLGHWRSGTTHLHELLALDDQFAFPTSYDCFAPHHCLVTGRLYPRLFGRLLPSKRLMDDMSIGFDRPQEDELALVSLGVPSPMWCLAYPEETYGQRYLTLRNVSERERDEWLSGLRHFMRLVTFRHPGKPLLLKSPPHTARIGLLAEMFPAARFLHVVRDPYVVFASTLHLWRKTQAANAIVHADSALLEDFVLRTLAEMYEGFEEATAALGARFYQLRYEDLVREPMVTLRRCYEALNLSNFDHIQPRVSEYLSALRDYRTNRYVISPEGRAAVKDAWGDIFRKWDYAI